MRLTDKKIRAFTLMELLVVLILTGIVTIMAYYVLNVTRSYYHRFHQQQQAVSTLSRLAGVVDRDFQRAVTITGDNPEIACDFKTHQVLYHFRPAYIVRSQSNLRDTFRLPVREMILRKTGGDGHAAVNLIHEMRLVVGSRDSVFLCFNKSYSAAVLLHGGPENGN